MNRSVSSKGPGRATRKGLSLVQITRMFPSGEAAAAWFVETRWPDGLQCPHCESPNVATVKSRKPMPYRCRSCRKHFSVRTNTLMQNSRLGYQVWAIAVYLMSTGIKGTAAMKLHRDLGIAYTSAWRLAHRIRETWRDAPPRSAAPSKLTKATWADSKRTSTRTRSSAWAAAPSASSPSLVSGTAPRAA